jgi:hypothetical protein
MLPHELTTTSKQAIQNRVAHEKWVKTCAEQRYRAECEITKARKSRNRSILATVMFFITITSAAFALGNSVAETGAKPGPITAKSELSKAEIKALNIMPSVSEKRK